MQALQGLKVTSSAGKDSLSPLWYVTFSEILTPILTDVYNFIWDKLLCHPNFL